MTSVLVLIVSLLSAVTGVSLGLECPAPFAQPVLVEAAFPPINLYLDERDFDGVLPGRVDLIASSVVGFPFGSLETLQLVAGSLPSIPSSLTRVPIHLDLEHSDDSTDSDGGNSTSPREIYLTASVWSLESSLAPPACAFPSLSTIYPGDNTSLLVHLPCSGVGTVFMQLCLSIGTEPFHLLNGTYQTFTIFFPRSCQGETENVCGLSSPTELVFAELCLSVNETIEVVNYGAAGWSLLLAIYQMPDDRGYCFVTNTQPGGITPILLNESLSQNFYIPEVFPDLELYIERTDTADRDATISYSASFTSEDESILSHPVANEPLSGLLPSQRYYLDVLLPCNAEGFVRVNVSFNTTALRGDVLYRRDINLHFFRSCYKEGVSVADNHLGLQVGIPISILFLLTVVVAIIATVLVLLTRHYKRKSYEVVCRRELARLSISNAYISSTHLNPFGFLEPYDIEYNYASLEIVSELGEGAFGLVYKARAPGIKRGDYIPPEFVAVKMLKEDSEYEAVEEFCKEVKVCVQFEHENVIRLLAVCTTSAHKCMIFEFMDLGNLGELLRYSDPDRPAHPQPDSQKIIITADMLLSIALQVANGLNYLTKLKFVHRDIATRNCLMNSNLTVKIADFGMSREVSSMDYYRIGSSKACLPVRWMPPEALMYGKFTLKSDVWSYGVLVWEVYSYGRQPHTGISNYEVIDRIKEGRLLECPTHCPPAIFDIIKSCWTRSPAKRATMETIWARLNQLKQFGQGEEKESESSKAAEGYLNLAFADVISEEELAESGEVEATLKERRERELADIAKLLEDSEDEEEGDEVEGDGEEERGLGEGERRNYDATEVEQGTSKETEDGQEDEDSRGVEGTSNDNTDNLLNLL